MRNENKDVMNVVNEKVKAVKAYIGSNLVSLLALLSMCIIFLFVSIMDFAEMKFEWERVRTRQFWINYILLMGLGVMMFFISVVYGKAKRKRTDSIMDMKQTMYILKNYLVDNCLETDFKAHLVSENLKCKVTVYQERMRLFAYFMPIKKRRLISSNKPIAQTWTIFNSAILDIENRTRMNLYLTVYPPVKRQNKRLNIQVEKKWRVGCCPH
jgi:hypothetical protein